MLNRRTPSDGRGGRDALDEFVEIVAFVEVGLEAQAVAG